MMLVRDTFLNFVVVTPDVQIPLRCGSVEGGGVLTLWGEISACISLKFDLIKVKSTKHLKILIDKRMEYNK